MVTLTAALADMQSNLTEVIRGSLDKGFELVAGVIGAKIVKSVEAAIKNAEFSVKKAGGGGMDLAGLREQIKENAKVLFPLKGWSNSSISLITQGMSDTGGIRALLLDDTTDPPAKMWSRKYDNVTDAMEDLLDKTQVHLKLGINALVGASPISPPIPAWLRNSYPSSPYPSFDAPSPTEDATATSTGTKELSDSKLLWDPDVHTNPSFKGFDYASFSKDSGFDSDEATCVDPDEVRVGLGFA